MLSHFKFNNIDSRAINGFLILATFSIVFYFFYYLFESSYNEFSKDYKIVETKDQFFVEVKWKQNQHGFTYVKSENDEKIVFPPTYNNSYIPEFFGEMVSIGDSIIKYSNSDIVMIKRNNDNYQYTIGARVNK